MDTTKEYIEMCCKAEELQKLTPGMGVSNDIPIAITEGNWFYAEGFRATWLPHQDQLQDMIGLWNVAHSLFDCYRCTPLFYVDKRPHFPFNVFDSLEQCWLAFVMHEKYGKRWDGSDWVVE